MPFISRTRSVTYAWRPLSRQVGWPKDGTPVFFVFVVECGEDYNYRKYGLRETSGVRKKNIKPGEKKWVGVNRLLKRFR